MSHIIRCRKAKFWIEDGVLYCKFIAKKCKNKFSDDFIEDYLDAITLLSNGRYYPLLIDLRKLNNNYAFSVIKILAKNPALKLAILSKSFVVKSYLIQFILIVLKVIQDPIIPNKVFRNYKKAVKYSQRTNFIFNTNY